MNKIHTMKQSSLHCSQNSTIGKDDAIKDNGTVVPPASSDAYLSIPLHIEEENEFPETIELTVVDPTLRNEHSQQKRSQESIDTDTKGILEENIVSIVLNTASTSKAKKRDRATRDDSDDDDADDDDDLCVTDSNSIHNNKDYITTSSIFEKEIHEIKQFLHEYKSIKVSLQQEEQTATTTTTGATFGTTTATSTTNIDIYQLQSQFNQFVGLPQMVLE